MNDVNNFIAWLALTTVAMIVMGVLLALFMEIGD